MQIQEGELMPHGYINKSSIWWKPIEEFSVLDNNVKNGVDYHTLSWEKRGLDLDDLVLDDNLLLTGTFMCKFMFLSYPFLNITLIIPIFQDSSSE